MTDFALLLDHCNRHSELSKGIIDDFLLYYAAGRDRVDREADNRLASYRHVTSRLDPTWKNHLKSQLIAHRIFKAGGLIGKYLNHVEIKRRSAPELQFLTKQSAKPWKFSFSVLKENPYRDFYEMMDVFTDEPFLLYSKSVTEILKEHPVMMWFNLIAFNDQCWQSFGPVSGYQSFDADDVFYFATEVNPRIEDESDLCADVDKNPVPYMMLFSGSNTPRLINNGHEVVMLMADYDRKTFDGSILQKDFLVEYKDGVYRAGLNGFNGVPHFAFVYYDERDELLRLSAATDSGFSVLTEKLNTLRLAVEVDSQIRVHPSMITAIGSILKKEFLSSSYEHLFSQPISEAERENMNRINKLIATVWPIINAGGTPDVEALAREAGVHPETVRQVIELGKEKMKDMGGK